MTGSVLVKSSGIENGAIGTVNEVVRQVSAIMESELAPLQVQVSIVLNKRVSFCLLHRSRLQ